MLTYVLPTLFGLEGLAADELRRLKLNNVRAADGRAFFDGTPDDAAAALLNITTAERLCILCCEFEALSFESLYDGVFSVDWAALLPANARFPVRGHCVSSRLMSVPDCRSIIKKAVASKLENTYGIHTFPEDGDMYQLRFNILRDRAQIMLDITGASLHKRGYRALSGEAPLRETVAAGMVNLARFSGLGAFRDPFCGSGTLVIEAALRAKGRAVGIKRSFDFEHMPGGADALKRARRAVLEREADIAKRYSDRQYDIAGSDIDPKAIELARKNAEAAGVSDIARFEVCDALQHPFGPSSAGSGGFAERGVVVCNPPYGERMGEQHEAAALMQGYGSALKRRGLNGWSVHIISPEPELEKLMGMRASKKRKLYNGSIKCDLFSFM